MHANVLEPPAIKTRSRIGSKIKELFSIDLRSLAAFRIALALVYLSDFIARASELKALYTDFGLLPRIAHLQTYQDPWMLSINMLSGSTPVQILLFVITGLAGIALLAGYRTRIASVVAWFMILSLDARNPLVLGENVFIRILLFWGMFLPLGARCSVDSVLNSSEEEPRPRILSMGTVALLLQVAIIYFCAGLFKLRSDGWLNGTALFSSLNYDAMVKPFGYFLLQFPGLMRFLTYGVMVFEIVGALLLFSPLLTVPLRLCTLLGFIVLLSGFFLCLELGPLTWSMGVAMIPFLPSAFWDYLSRKLADFQPDAEKVTKSVKEQLSRRLALRPVRVRPSLLGTILAALSFVYVAASNWGSLAHYEIPYSIRRFGGSLLWMDQYWNMFSPPPGTGGWNVIEGRQKKGSSVDLFNEGRPVSWQKPPLISATFKSQLWRKFWHRIITAGYEVPRAYYAQYLCREWNLHHEGEDQIYEIEIFQMQTGIFPATYQVSEPQKISYGKYPC